MKVERVHQTLGDNFMITVQTRNFWAAKYFKEEIDKAGFQYELTFVDMQNVFIFKYGGSLEGEKKMNEDLKQIREIAKRSTGSMEKTDLHFNFQCCWSCRLCVLNLDRGYVCTNDNRVIKKSIHDHVCDHYERG